MSLSFARRPASDSAAPGASRVDDEYVYLKRSLGARVFVKLSPGSPIAKVKEIAAKHPVFKILEV